MKITNNQIIEVAQMKKSTFYKLQKHNPRQAELIRKGVIAEMVLNQRVFDNFLKPTQRNSDGFK